jgi:hypothetical protein
MLKFQIIISQYQTSIQKKKPFKYANDGKVTYYNKWETVIANTHERIPENEKSSSCQFKFQGDVDENMLDEFANELADSIYSLRKDVRFSRFLWNRPISVKVQFVNEPKPLIEIKFPILILSRGVSRIKDQDSSLNAE